MTAAERIYETTMRGARRLLPLLARGEGKLARGIRGRRDVVARVEGWAERERDRARPLVWFHAPSVGEGLQARIVVELLREQAPDLQLVYTFFSPSAERFAQSVPADFADYLPLDTPKDVGRTLAALDPAVIAFTKTEVWPTLAREAKGRGTRLALLSATLPAGSSRLSRLARPLLTPGFARLDRLAAISAEDADRFRVLGIPPARRMVMGDARFDQVWQRTRSIDPTSPLQSRLRDGRRTTLVAGSTWPPDEDHLIAASSVLRDAGVDLRLILVPHEPTDHHLRRLESGLARHGLSTIRFSQIERGAGTAGVAVIVVDRVGILGEVYAVADIAYVGGGFGRAGLHSVLEPAAFGTPVLFGPRHGNAREAAELVHAGGAFVAETPDNMGDLLLQLATEPDLRLRVGALARDYVQARLGAAQRGVDVIRELLEEHQRTS